MNFTSEFNIIIIIIIITIVVQLSISIVTRPSVRTDPCHVTPALIEWPNLSLRLQRSCLGCGTLGRTFLKIINEKLY